MVSRLNSRKKNRIKANIETVKTTVFNRKLSVIVEEDEIEEEVQAARPETKIGKSDQTLTANKGIEANIKIVNITVWNPKLSTIIEQDEEDIEDEVYKHREEDIELPRSSDDEQEHDSSFNSCADLEDFSDDEDIIAYAKKVNRMCEELEKVECFSDPVEHTIALAKDMEATFRKWDEEELEAFSDSTEDTIAIAKQVEVDTRPSPPESPVRAPSSIRTESPTHTPEGAPCFTESGFLAETPGNTPVDQTPEVPGTRFSESGFLIESPDNSPAAYTPAPISRISRIPKAVPKITPKAAPQTPVATDLRKSIFGSTTQKPVSGTPAQKPIFGSPVEKPTLASPTTKLIFASPVGSPFNHTRKVSNESNTTEESNDTAGTTTTTTATDTVPDSPTSVYSTLDTDNVYEYQAMTGFTVCLSAKKGTGITFDPIAISGENINYDREALKEITPSPTSSHFGNPDDNNQSTTASADDLETPYHYSANSSEDLEILAILERPNGPKYAKLSCGNWYSYNDADGSVDHLNWEEYEDLIRFIVGDVASLPVKLHKFAIEAAEKHNEHMEEREREQQGEERIATVD